MLCYITLPTLGTEERTYSTAEYEMDDGDPRIRGAMFARINLPSRDGMKHRVKHFRRMLRALSLDPYIHERQRGNTITVDTTRQASDGGHRVNEGIEWPQLVLLAEDECNSS